MGRHQKVLIAGLACLAIVAGIGPAAAQPREYVIDPDHFSIAFAVEHIGYAAVHGLFTEGAGHFVYDEGTGELSDLEATIQTASVFTGHERRDGHVRGGDFLDAETYPEIHFVMTGAERLSDTTGVVHGDLTIRGVTQPVTLDVTLNKIEDYPFPASNPNHVIGATVTTTVRRSDFGMTYAVENGWVGDEVPLTIAFEAVGQ